MDDYNKDVFLAELEESIAKLTEIKEQIEYGDVSADNNIDINFHTLFDWIHGEIYLV